ncbi:MAG: WG repeat-containing protein [Clostridia bacterium]|nr:WG repeat-containing protein [Clostridia bacterium]
MNRNEKQNENKIQSAVQGRMRSLFSRLLVAFLFLSLGAVLILWDAGFLELPFLKRKDRRPPVTEEETYSDPFESKEETVTLTEEEIVVDWNSFAREQIEALYDFSFLENGASMITAGDFSLAANSIVKTRLPKQSYTSARGYLISPAGKLYRGGDLAPVAGSEAYAITSYLSESGLPVFLHKETGEYFVLDGESLAFSPIGFDPAQVPHGSSLYLPATYGAGEEGRHLTFSQGLFGYTGSYKEGWRTRTFTVEPQYQAAFEYSEGFAVMANAEGRVTIRGSKGEEVFTHQTLVLPDKKGEEALGFHYFDHGLLRVAFATYDETGSLTGAREGVINTAGDEYTFPEGYIPYSYYNGVFVLTNGETFGYYSAMGAWITSPIYTEAHAFREGLAVVRNKDGKAGLIDMTGKEILPCAFDEIDDFSDGISTVHYEEGSFLLVKVTGNFMPEGMVDAKPPVTSLTTKITITRGPENTFVQEEDTEILELPEIVITTTKKIPEFWK